MKHRPEDHRGPHGHHNEHHHHGHHKEGRRHFDYGELRVLLLAMIARRPSHGYELIKAIEEQMGGTYTPSPGVMYPTLAWLDDMGYASVDAESGGRKLYRITPEGEAFLTANRKAADELLVRKAAGRGRGGEPDVIGQAMDKLKTALRTRIGNGMDEDAANRIAAAIERAAEEVESSDGR